MTKQFPQEPKRMAQFAAITFTLMFGVSGTGQAAEATDIVCIGCVGAEDLADGSVTSPKITDGAIGEGHLSASSVTSAKIKDGAIGTADLANGSVTSAKIAIGAVGAAKLANGSITSPKIADGTILEADLANGSVTSPKIADGAIGTADLANGSVTSAKIADGAIGTMNLSIGSVVGAHIITGAIKEGHLSAGSVTSAKIKDGAIKEADLANGSVTSTKIKNGAIGEAELAPALLDRIASLELALDRITALEAEVAILKGIPLYSQATFKGTYRCRELNVGSAWNAQKNGGSIVYESSDGSIIADGFGTFTGTFAGYQATHSLYVESFLVNGGTAWRLKNVIKDVPRSDSVTSPLPYTVGADGKLTFVLGSVETVTGWLSVNGDTAVMQYLDGNATDLDYFRSLNICVRTAH